MGALHSWMSWPLIVANGAAGVWALTAHWLRPLRGRALWVFTATAETLLFVQAMLGGLVVAGDEREVGQGHMFYGFLTLTGIAILYGYRRQLDPWLHLLYGFGGLFIMGLAIRAHYLPAWS